MILLEIILRRGQPASTYQGFARKRIRHRFDALSLIVACLLGGAATAAFADCQPASPSSGQTVNWSGNAPTGFPVVNPAVNNLNVMVAPRATVQDNGAFSIQLNNGNAVVNNGSVAGGAGVTGIAAVDSNTITNNLAVTVGDACLALSRGTAFTATLSGEFSDRTQSYAGRAGLRMEF